MRSQSKFPKQKGFFLKTGCSLETRYKVVDEGFTDNLMIDYHDFTISRHKKNGPLVWKIFSIGGFWRLGGTFVLFVRFVSFVSFCSFVYYCQTANSTANLLCIPFRRHIHQPVKYQMRGRFSCDIPASFRFVSFHIHLYIVAGEGEGGRIDEKWRVPARLGDCQVLGSRA